MREDAGGPPWPIPRARGRRERGSGSGNADQSGGGWGETVKSEWVRVTVRWAGGVKFLLCRLPPIRYSAKYFFLIFFNSLSSATLTKKFFFKKIIFVECPDLALDKIFFNFFKFFAECYTSWHSAKRLLCRAPNSSTRQTIIFSLLTSKLFLQSSYNTWCSMF